MRDQLEIICDDMLNEPLDIPEVAKVQDWSVSRLLKIHEAAELELQDLEADFQARVEESVLQAEFHFAEKFAAAEQEFQRREQEIQAAANQLVQNTTDEFTVERKEFQERIAALEEELASSKKTSQQAIRTPLSRQLETQLEEAMRDKARLEEELKEATHRNKTDGIRLEKLKTSKALPQVWEL